MTTGPALARRLGTSDAITSGLGSMIGAGVFAVPRTPVVGGLVVMTAGIGYRLAIQHHRSIRAPAP